MTHKGREHISAQEAAVMEHCGAAFVETLVDAGSLRGYWDDLGICRVRYDQLNKLRLLAMDLDPCPVCDGLGRVPGAECDKCGGTGVKR